MKKTLFKKVAILLLMVMVTQVAFGNYAYGQEIDGVNKYSNEFYGTDGVKYSVEIEADCVESYTMTVTNLETFDQEITEYDYGIVDYSEHEYKGRTWFGKEIYSCKNEEITDMREYIKEAESAEVNAQGYGAAETMIFYKYKAADGNKYSYNYAVGNSGSDYGYTKISCVKSYKVRNSNSNLINYKNAVIDANEYFYGSGVSIAEAAAVFSIFVALSVASAGIAVVAGVLITTFGIEAKSVNCLIKSYQTGKKAQTYYDSAKLSAV